MVAAGRSPAHPGHALALDYLNERITTQPADVESYVQRAGIWTDEENWPAAEADLTRATQLDPESVDVERGWGHYALARGQWRQAVGHFSTVLSSVPDDPETLVWRARAERELGPASLDQAYADYSAALRLIPRASPNLFHERATLAVAPERRLAGLADGLAQVGPVVSLMDQAITLEQQLGRFDAALAHVDEMIATAERKEIWLRRRGDILVAAGRIGAARDAYAAALREVTALPDWLRTAPSISVLETELRRSLKTLSR